MIQITRNTPCTALLIISLDISQTGIILLYTHPQVVYYNLVKFHQYQFIPQGVLLMKHMDRQADRQRDGQTGRGMDRQADRQRVGQSGRGMDRQAE